MADMDGITDDALDDLVARTFRFEPDKPEPKGLLDIMRSRRRLNGSLMQPVRFTRPGGLPRLAEAPRLTSEVDGLGDMEF